MVSARPFSPALLLVAVLVACGPSSASDPSTREPSPAPSSEMSERSAPEAAHSIFVISNGWHTSIAIAREDLPPDRVPEAADFPGARFLEFGWGDAEFYPAKEVTLGMTLRAALVPTPSVMHVAGLPIPPARRYPEAKVVSLPIDAAGLARLVGFIDASFERKGLARAAASGPGLYPDSRFYPAKGNFHLFNTCNTWTARALVEAGFRTIDPGTTRAGDLMRQVRLVGKRR